MPRTALANDSVAGRREQRKALNRAKLMAAARRVFAEKGVGEATARDIVRETDLASGTFYNYFQDKEEVFQAILEEIAEKARAAVRARRREPGRTLEQRIEGAYRAYFELAVEERELFQVLRRNSGAIAGDEHLFEPGIEELFEDLDEWVEAGDLPRLDLDYLATAMVGTGFQIATHLVDREPPDIDAATQFCTRLFLGGIRALAEAPPPG